MDRTDFFVTQGAAADDTNGGGPSLGTNDGPVATRTNADAVLVAGTEYTLEDKDNGGWGTTAVDDWVCWDTAGVKEYARVVQLSYGADDDVILVDAPGGLTVSTGKTVNVGGAWASPQHACDTVSTDFVNAASDPPRINVKTGTYTLTGALTPANDGTTEIPVALRAYTTTPGDAVVPVVTLDINNVNGHVINTDKDHWLFEYLTLTGNAAYASKRGATCTGEFVRFRRCRATNVGKDGFYLAGIGALCWGCEADAFGQAASGTGFVFAANQTATSACHAHDGIGDGYKAYYAYVSEIGACIAANNSQYGLVLTANSVSAATLVDGFVAYKNGEHGIYADNTDPTPNTPLLLLNAIVAKNGDGGTGDGIAAASGKLQIVLHQTAFWDNADDDIGANVIVHEPQPRITLTADPFVDAANHDYTLKPDALALLGTGLPSAWLAGGQLQSAGGPEVGAVAEPIRRLGAMN